MAAELFSTPSSPAYHRDTNLVVLQTDQIEIIPATVHIDIDAGGPAIDDELTIACAGNTITFIVAALAPSADALSLPEQGALSLSAYADVLVEVLRQNSLLTTDWHVWRGSTVGAAERITLRQIVPGLLDVTVTNGLSNVTTTVGDGANPFLQDNLSAYLQVFQAETDPNGDLRLVSLHATYEASTAQAFFDLKDLFSLQPALPNTGSIAPTVYSLSEHAVAAGAFVAYYLRYADKYGLPAVSEALLKSATYYMLHGSQQASGLAGSSPTPARLQHSYHHPAGDFIKPVFCEQPDWVYLWVHTAITGVHIQLVLTWADGTVLTEDVPISYFDLTAKRLYWFASGPLQHADTWSGIHPTSHLTAYTWRLLGDPGGGEVTITEVKYSVDTPANPWHFTLLMENGLGGCESVWIRGKVKSKYEAERDVARRPRWFNFSQALGELFTFNAEGQQVWEVNTGWHELYYIEHLRQLLLGQLWIVDIENSRFLRVVCDTKSIEINENDQQLFSLSILLRAAWMDTNYNLNT